jgi:hypothetical protein
VKLFQQKLTKDEYKKLWAGNNTGIGDVLVALQYAKKTYDERKAQQSGVRTLLSIFSSRLVYYGAILDTVRKTNTFQDFIRCVPHTLEILHRLRPGMWPSLLFDISGALFFG